MSKGGVVSVRTLSVERLQRWEIAALAAGFVSETGLVKVSSWLRSLGDQAAPVNMPRKVVEQVKRKPARVFRDRPIHPSTDSLEPAKIAPDCGHVAVGAYCKRCGEVRK